MHKLLRNFIKETEIIFNQIKMLEMKNKATDIENIFLIGSSPDFIQPKKNSSQLEDYVIRYYYPN